MRARATRCCRGLLSLQIGVHLFAEFLRRRAQRFDLGVDGSLVGTLERFFQFLQGTLDLGLFGRIELVAILSHRFLGAVNQRFALVTRLGQLAQLVIFGCVDLGVFHHLVDFGFGQTRVCLDRDLVFLAGCLVLRADVQDTIGVDVERDFDLRHATRRRRDAFEVEFAQQLVTGRHLALALEHLDRHGTLIVVSGRIHLRVLGRDRRVFLDHLGHHATQRFDAQRQRRHVQQQHVLAVARQNLTLNRGADSYGFVRIHVAARFLAEEFLDLLLHHRHTRHTADQNHVVDVADLDTCVADRNPARFHGALDQLFNQGFELGAGNLQVQVLRTACIRRDIRQIDFGLLRARQFDLGFFGSFFQALQCQYVFRQIDALFFLELGNDVFDDALVEIFTAQEGIAVGGEHFELLFAVDVGDFDNRHVEGAAAQVIHSDLAITLVGLVEAERERRSGRFIDNALHFQARDTARVLGCLALAVVEVSRHGNHGFGHRLAQVVLGGFLHLAQDFRGNLRRRQFLLAYADPCIAVIGFHDGVGHQRNIFLHFFLFEAAADQALDCVQRIARIGHSLAFGRRADQNFAVFHVSDNRRSGTSAFRVFDHTNLIAFHDRDTRIGCAEVNTDDSAHFFNLLTFDRRRIVIETVPECS